MASRAGSHARRGRIGIGLLAFVVLLAGCDGDPVTGLPEQEQPVPVVEPVRAVVIEPFAGELEPGASVRLAAEPRDRLGRVLNRPVVWQTTDPSVATVTGTGIVTATGPGAVRIRATSDGVSAELGLVVRATQPPPPPPPPPPAPVARVETLNGALVLEELEHEVILVRLLAENGTELSGRTVTFVSADPAVATVTSYGTVAAVGLGETHVTVASEGRSTTVRVRIVPRPVFGLIYDRVGATGNELFTLALFGGMPARLNAGNVSRHPSPSPDGRRLVFAVTQPDPLTGALQYDLYVVDRTGLNMRRLTSGIGVESAPVWSPDGTRIAFAGTAEGTGAQDVFVVNADGSGIVDLTPNTMLTHEADPAWSPDSRSIAFTSLHTLGGSHLYTVGADGTGMRQVTLGDAGALASNTAHPTWSPDGSRIAFSRRFADGDIDIAIVPATGGVPSRVHVIGEQLEPVWSPDGGHFAYSGVELLGRSQIFTVRIDGTAVRRRTNSVDWGGGRNPAWIRLD